MGENFQCLQRADDLGDVEAEAGEDADVDKSIKRFDFSFGHPPRENHPIGDAPLAGACRQRALVRSIADDEEYDLWKVREMIGEGVDHQLQPLIDGERADIADHRPPGEGSAQPVDRAGVARGLRRRAGQRAGIVVSHDVDPFRRDTHFADVASVHIRENDHAIGRPGHIGLQPSIDRVSRTVEPSGDARAVGKLPLAAHLIDERNPAFPRGQERRKSHDEVRRCVNHIGLVLKDQLADRGLGQAEVPEDVIFVLHAPAKISVFDTAVAGRGALCPIFQQFLCPRISNATVSPHRERRVLEDRLRPDRVAVLGVADGEIDEGEHLRCSARRGPSEGRRPDRRRQVGEREVGQGFVGDG